MITSFADLMKGILLGIVIAIIVLFLAKFGIIPLPLNMICPTVPAP